MFKSEILCQTYKISIAGQCLPLKIISHFPLLSFFHPFPFIRVAMFYSFPRKYISCTFSSQKYFVKNCAECVEDVKSPQDVYYFIITEQVISCCH